MTLQRWQLALLIVVPIINYTLIGGGVRNSAGVEARIMAPKMSIELRLEFS